MRTGPSPYVRGHGGLRRCYFIASFFSEPSVGPGWLWAAGSVRFWRRRAMRCRLRRNGFAEVRYSAIGTATGLRLDAQVAHVWDFNDGKVVRWQQYTDTRQFADVMERSQG